MSIDDKPSRRSPEEEQEARYDELKVWLMGEDSPAREGATALSDQASMLLVDGINSLNRSGKLEALRPDLIRNIPSLNLQAPRVESRVVQGQGADTSVYGIALRLLSPKITSLLAAEVKLHSDWEGSPHEKLDQAKIVVGERLAAIARGR